MKSATQKAVSRDNTISKVVDRVLTQIFGKEAASLIYMHLERHYSVKPAEIGEKLELFAKGLEDFCKSGAYVIERKILEDIWTSYGSVHRLQLARPANEMSFAHEAKVLLREA